MKIAQIAPLIERVPPKKYGGTERVVYALTEELIKRGHQVTLFASGDSITSAKLVSVYPRGLREAKLKNIYGRNVWTLLSIGLAYKNPHEFDIIHDHVGIDTVPIANVASTPSVMTIHGQFNVKNRRLYQQLNRPHIVTISKGQGVLPDINHAGVVYNGLRMNDYPFSETHEGYLLFVGRISYEKGVHNAIEAALMLDMPLIIAAKLEEGDRTYYQEFVEPYLSERIKWIGEVDEQERNKLMSKALCFLHPVTWHEPFGLTLIESMACGSPVIAFNKGSIPEIIVDGKTGFIVNTVDEMVEAITKLDTIKRADCRQHVLENFSAEKMTDGYERIYEKILKKEI